MSRIGKKPVAVPAGRHRDRRGTDGQRSRGRRATCRSLLHDDITAKLEKGAVQSTRATRPSVPAPCGACRARWSPTSSTGVTKGFEKRLEITGVGYRAAVQGKNLQLLLGYSHDVDYPIPDGIAIVTPKPTEIVITGIDKQQVGQVAAEIREFRPPEPYKGKGVKYAGEYIFRKEGKKK